VFQLEQYLRTLHLFGGVEEVHEVNVLWTASTDELVGMYHELESEFYWVKFVKESCFAEQLVDIVRNTPCEYILFGVDDAVFYNKLELKSAMATFGHDDAVSVFHVKLSRNMTFCHPASKNMTSPSAEHFVYFENTATFPLGQGTYDWDYPWDLCGSMYKKQTVSYVLGKLEPKQYSHPNLLEVNGTRVFPRRGRRAAFFTGGQVMAVVTVNRVQDLYKNPVYRQASSTDDIDLNERFGREQFDLGAFQQQEFASVHVGFHACEKLVDVSVVLPFRNVANYLGKAIRSILDQTLDPSQFELLLIDDGSTDESVEIAETFVAQNPKHCIRVLTSPGRGISDALNHGIRYTRSKLIARMDADDVSLPERLKLQLGVMQKRPCLKVLGTGCSVVDTIPNNLDRLGEMKTAQIASGSQFVAWSLYFFCCIIHPSVVMRWTVLLHLGGYRAVNAEDYDLWLRAATKGIEMDNLKQVLHIHLCQPESITARQTLSSKRKTQANTVVRMLEKQGVGINNLHDCVYALHFGIQPSIEKKFARDCVSIIQHIQTTLAEPRCDKVKRDAESRLMEIALRANDPGLWDMLERTQNISQLKAFQRLVFAKVCPQQLVLQNP